MTGSSRFDAVVVGACWGALGVVLGAFGAHALPKVRPSGGAEATAWWETAARYHLLGAVAMVAAGLLERWTGRPSRAAWAFLAGSAVFSGSLYAMALGAGRGLGAVTPLGGLGLVLGWALLAWEARRGRGPGPTA